MENIKTLPPLILMAFFFMAAIVTLVAMGVKSILNKKKVLRYPQKERLVL